MVASHNFWDTTQSPSCGLQALMKFDYRMPPRPPSLPYSPHSGLQAVSQTHGSIPCPEPLHFLFCFPWKLPRCLCGLLTPLWHSFKCFFLSLPHCRLLNNLPTAFFLLLHFSFWYLSQCDIVAWIVCLLVYRLPPPPPRKKASSTWQHFFYFVMSPALEQGLAYSGNSI